MSKTGKYLSNFIVGSLLTTTMLTPAYSQSVQGNINGEADPVFTETVQQADSRRRDINDLSSADARRNQLLGISDPALVTPQATPTVLPSSTQQRAQPALAVTPLTNPADPDGSTLGNIAIDPVQTGTPATQEADPFGPTGIRLGTFDLNVSLEQAIGYSSNVSEQANGDGGAFSETSVSANITSNWSRHSKSRLRALLSA